MLSEIQHTRLVVCGNYKPEQALELAEQITAILKLKSNELLVKTKIANIKAGQLLEWDSLHISVEEAKSEGSDEEMGEDEQQEDSQMDSDEGDKENNSCASLYYQSDRIGNFAEYVVLDLLEAMIDEEMFDALRTK